MHNLKSKIIFNINMLHYKLEGRMLLFGIIQINLINVYYNRYKTVGITGCTVTPQSHNKISQDYTLIHK